MEDEDPTPRYSKEKRKPVFRRDRHLQSALHSGEIQYLFDQWDNPAGLKKEHLDLQRDTQGVTFLSSDQYIHWALLHISGACKDSTTGQDLSRHIRIANDALNLGSQDYCGVSVEGPPLRAPPLLRQTYSIKKALTRIVHKITFSEHHSASYSFFGCPSRCYGNLHVVWPSDKFVYIITHSHFLAVRDCVNAWFSTLSYGLIASRKYPTYNLYNEVANVIYAVLHDISIYKDDTYDILKSWQPLVIATILKDIEGDPHFMDSLREIGARFQNSILYKIATRRITSSIDVHVALELTGMTKCFGHPEVVMNESVAAWVDKGTILKSDLADVAEEIRRAFVLEFSRNFFKQKRKWPNLLLGNDADPYVRQCYDGGYWGERTEDPWTTTMFRDIRFKKTLEFDYQIYTADLLADKAIIPGLNHWPYEYDSQAHRTLYGRFPSVPPRESSNVIMQYIGREEVNVRDIIQTVSSGQVPANWKVTVGVAKEREMKKRKARFFGKLVLEMRLFQVATENNIKHVFKYIPHQTMTKTEDDLFKHLLKISETSSTEAGGAVFMSMDFSSWCTSFRYEGVTPLFEELDRLLGVDNVFAYTQKFPLESILLFQDRFCPPRQGLDGLPVSGPRCFHGPEAWMEGLRQKGWTLATLLLILVASWKCGTIATLTGQGDNQVIYLRLPNRTTLEGLRMTRAQYISWFQETLLTLCTRAGISLKLEETWVSSSLLEYGREFFFKGAQVSSSLKRVSRMASEANQTIPSFNGDIAGLYSAGMGSAQKDHLPIPSYWCTILEASIMAQERFPALRRYPTEYLVCLLMVPRTLGGWPITLFANFCTRAVQDPLTCALHMVRTLMKSPRFRAHIIRIATVRMKSSDPTMLIKDPQSLPLVMPRQPENYLKNKISEGLPSLIRNVELKPLFDPSVELKKQQLVADLMDIVPCNPKLLSKIMTLSNIGKQEALVSKFSSTRSIQAVACREWSSELEVLRDIRSMENTMFDHVINRGPDMILDILPRIPCLTQLAQELREKGWARPVEGVTMPAQQEQAQLCKWENIPISHYDKTITFALEGDPSQEWSLSRGSVSPYIGAPTRVRAKRQPLQEMESYSYTQSLSQALQLRSWVKGDAGLTRLLDTIIHEKTDATTEELDRRTAHVYSGSLTHRLPCPTMSRGGQSNSTSNFASHVRITSSTATAYAKKGEDYTICFQSVFLYGIASLNILYHKYGTLPDKMGLVLSRGCCTWTIPPEVFTLLNSSYEGVSIPSAILHIDPIEETTLPYSPRILGIRDSYAAHMAYKFAVWILNRRDTTRISTLEHRAVNETLTPPFVNLSEISRLSLDSFFQYFICYLILLDMTFSFNPYAILIELKTSSTRTGFDDLIDSILLGGLTHSLCSLTYASPIDLQDRDGWRMVIADLIASHLDKGILNIISTRSVLIPEETKHIFICWYRALAYRLKRRVDRALFNSMGSQELVDFLERARRECGLKVVVWPPLALSEEESVAGIRQCPRPSYRPINKIPLPITPCPSFLQREHADEDIEVSMHCVAGGRLVNQVFETMIHLKELFEDMEEDGMDLYTVGDKNGAIYSLICHMLPIAIVSGFPRWDMTALEAQGALETGPSCVSGDACSITYDHNGFLANIGESGPTRRAKSGKPELWVVNGTPSNKVPRDATGFILTNSPAPPPSPWKTYRIYRFQQVRGIPNTRWTLWRRDIVDPVLQETPIGLGNSSPESSLLRPMECATTAQVVRSTCFCVLSPVYHLLQGSPDCRKDLCTLVRKGLERCLRMIPDLIDADNMSGFMEPIREHDADVRRGVADKIAIFGLIGGLAKMLDARLALVDQSYVRFHVHYCNGRPARLCQRKGCRRDERVQVFRRRFAADRLLKWWKPCVLLAASLVGLVDRGVWNSIDVVASVGVRP